MTIKPLPKSTVFSTLLNEVLGVFSKPIPDDGEYALFCFSDKEVKTVPMVAGLNLKESLNFFLTNAVFDPESRNYWLKIGIKVLPSGEEVCECGESLKYCAGNILHCKSGKVTTVQKIKYVAAVPQILHTNKVKTVWPSQALTLI